MLNAELRHSRFRTLATPRQAMVYPRGMAKLWGCTAPQQFNYTNDMPILMIPKRGHFGAVSCGWELPLTPRQPKWQGSIYHFPLRFANLAFVCQNGRIPTGPDVPQ